MIEIKRFRKVFFPILVLLLLFLPTVIFAQTEGLSNSIVEDTREVSSSLEKDTVKQGSNNESNVNTKLNIEDTGKDSLDQKSKNVSTLDADESTDNKSLLTRTSEEETVESTVSENTEDLNSNEKIEDEALDSKLEHDSIEETSNFKELDSMDVKGSNHSDEILDFDTSEEVEEEREKDKEDLEEAETLEEEETENLFEWLKAEIEKIRKTTNKTGIIELREGDYIFTEGLKINNGENITLRGKAKKKNKAQLTPEEAGEEGLDNSHEATTKNEKFKEWDIKRTTIEPNEPTSNEEKIESVKDNELSIVFKRDDKLNEAMITVESGAKLSLEEDIVFDGEYKDLRHSKYNPRGLVLDIGGEVYINGPTIKRFVNTSDTSWYRAPIFISGKENRRAKLTIDDILLTDNYIKGKQSSTSKIVSYYGYGAIYLQHYADLILNNGEISNNRASNGTIQVGSSKGVDLSDKDCDYSVTFVMNGGSIRDNKAFSWGNHGGAVTVQRSSNFIMNGGDITNNFSYFGGGVHVDSRFIKETDGEHYTELRDKSKEDYYHKYPTGFILDGGTIEGNSARTGGGIYINSDGVEIISGKIINNSAKFQGGGIYVSMIPIHFELTNAFITENSANFMAQDIRSASQGGGFWGCPTNQFFFNVKDGNIFYNNRAEEKGSDIFTTGKETEFEVNGENISDRFITIIKPVDRYGREINFISENENTQLVTTEEVAYKLVFDEESLEEAKKLPVLIAGNQATRGGGIGSNAAIDSGIRNDFKLDVVKIWKQDENSENKVDNKRKIRLKLYFKDKLVDLFTIDSSKVYTFTNIFEGEGEGQANINNYKLVEESVEGYQSDIELMKKSDYYGEEFSGEDGFVFIVTNTEIPPDEPDEPDEPPEEPDEPDEPDEPPETPDEPPEPPDEPPETPDEPPKRPPREPKEPPKTPPEEPKTPPEEPDIPEEITKPHLPSVKEPEKPEEPPEEITKPHKPSIKVPNSPKAKFEHRDPKKAPKTFDLGISLDISTGLLSMFGVLWLEKKRRNN